MSSDEYDNYEIRKFENSCPELGAMPDVGYVSKPCPKCAEKDADLALLEDIIYGLKRELMTVISYRDEFKTKLDEITAMIDIYKSNSREWKILGDKLFENGLPDEPPESIVYSIINVLCMTTIDLVNHAESNSQLKANLETAREALENIRNAQPYPAGLAFKALKQIK